MDIMHYRGIQLLNQDFNKSFGTFIVPSLKLTLLFVTILSFFAVVRLSHGMYVLLNVMMPIFTIIGIGLLFLVSANMSSLFDISEQFKRNCFRNIELISDKKARIHFMGQLKACSLIRGQVGSLYHMEARAKLTLIQHLVNGLVFVLVNVKVK